MSPTTLLALSNVAAGASDRLVDIAMGALVAQAVASIIAMVGIVAIGRRFLATEFPNFRQEVHEDLSGLERAVRDLEKSSARLDQTDINLERRLSQIEGEMRALRGGFRGNP